ncbi:MAG: hypothetical protein JW929_10290 [Anaerolineales bacterium]|nr:hypothetical protein [Anaerolineales bacterium]
MTLPICYGKLGADFPPRFFFPTRVDNPKFRAASSAAGNGADWARTPAERTIGAILTAWEA